MSGVRHYLLPGAWGYIYFSYFNSPAARLLPKGLGKDPAGGPRLRHILMADSLFSLVKAAPEDPILGVGQQFKADTRPQKVNLSVGMYQTEEGKIPVLKVVREAETRLFNSEIPHAYGPISGNPALPAFIQELLFGKDSEVIRSKRACTVQSLGGTGALKLAADLLHVVVGKTKAATSVPTWGNHNTIFSQAGYELAHYQYYDKAQGAIPFEHMLDDLRALDTGTVVILHACCHNPTGLDFSAEQWGEVLKVVIDRGLVPVLDIAYQGFNQGLDEDAAAIRLFAKAGISFLVSSSFSKNFSLYGERIGGLTVVTQSEEEAKRILSQVKQMARANYSNPPNYGGNLVAIVAGDPALRAEWKEEVTAMRKRIREMRFALVKAMEEAGTPRDFSFVTRQNGMFSFTGFTPDQIERLKKEYAIYAVGNGRICIAGINNHNVEYVAKAFTAVQKN